MGEAMNKQELQVLLAAMPDDAGRISVHYAWSIEWGKHYVVAFNSAAGRVPDGWSLVHHNDQPPAPLRRFYQRTMIELGERNGKA